MKKGRFSEEQIIGILKQHKRAAKSRISHASRMPECYLVPKSGSRPEQNHAVAKRIQLRSILPHLAMCLRTEDRSDFPTVLRGAVRLDGLAVLAVARCRS